MSLFLHTFNVYVCRCDYSAKWLVNLRIFFSFFFFLSPLICSTDGFGVTLQHLSLCLDWSIMFSFMKMEWRRTFNFMNRRLSPKCIIIALLPVGISHGGVKIWGGKTSSELDPSFCSRWISLSVNGSGAEGSRGYFFFSKEGQANDLPEKILAFLHEAASNL